MEIYPNTKRGSFFWQPLSGPWLQFTCFMLNILSWFLQVRVKPGESALAFYTAENRSSTPITGVSTYNVTPMKVRINIASFYASNFAMNAYLLPFCLGLDHFSHKNVTSLNEISSFMLDSCLWFCCFWRLRFTSIKSNASALRSSAFFPGSILTCPWVE